MSLSTTTNKVSYTGNGVTTAFAFSFYCLAQGDLKVYVNGVLQTINTNYTVTINSGFTGGTVTFLSAPANGAAVLIKRVMTQDQQTTFNVEDKEPSKLIEQGLDKLTMLIQQLNETLGRSFSLSETSTSTASLTVPDPVAGRQLEWNPTATGLQNSSMNYGDALVAPAASVVGAIMTTKGDLLTRNASSFAVTSVGSNNQVLTADSTNANGIAWKAAYNDLVVGTMYDFAGSSAPAKHQLLYAQAISRSTYSALFALIGTTYGAGDGSTTFNLPDFRGRVAVGLDNMGGSAASRITSASTNGANSTTLGGAIGSETHTLTLAQLPDFLAGNASAKVVQTGGSGLTVGAGTGFTGGSSSIVITNGSGTAHSNTQPGLMTNKIIYAGV